MYKKVEPKAFVNALDPLLGQLRKRQGIIYLKRLTVVLDEDSEKGFGLVRAEPFVYVVVNFINATIDKRQRLSLRSIRHHSFASHH